MFHKLHLESHQDRDSQSFADRHTTLLVLAVWVLIFGTAIASMFITFGTIW